MGRKKENYEASFTKKIFKDQQTGCWLWTASLNNRGYGWFRDRQNNTMTAHRASWIIFRGEIPKGMNVLHKCDMPKCVNPDHLWLGTKLENTADMIAKGRQKYVKGEDTYNHVLTELDIREIRLDHRTQREIASDYGVNQCTVWKIKQKKVWRHVE